MKSIKEALAEKRALTPESGFNLIGLDDFGKPDEQGLYLIDHYDDVAAADTELKKRQAANPNIKYYVYGPSK